MAMTALTKVIASDLNFWPLTFLPGVLFKQGAGTFNICLRNIVMQLYSNWKSVLQTFMKTSNAELFSNQPLYFKYCWAIFHKRASVSTFLILQQSPQFIFEQLCKNPPCPSSEFPSYERCTAYSYIFWQNWFLFWQNWFHIFFFQISDVTPPWL